MKPNASGFLYAGGGSDFWNQQVLFCPTGLPNRFSIYANLGAAYWDTYHSYPLAQATQSPYFHEYVVTKFDAKFWTIWSVGREGYLYADANVGGYLFSNRGGFLGGDTLFEITPSDLGG